MKSLTRFLAIASLLASPALLAFPPHGQPASGSASGDSYWDFRFGLGAEPMLSEAEYETDSGAEYEADWEAGGGSLEFNVAHRFDAPSASSGYITFGLFLRGFGGENDPDTGAEVSLGSGGVQFGGGWSYRPSARYALEIGPRIGLGIASATEEFNGGEYESEGGGYARFDVGATNLINFGKFQLGATLGLASWAATVPYDGQWVYENTGPVYYEGADATYSGSGAYLLLSLGFR